MNSVIDLVDDSSRAGSSSSSPSPVTKSRKRRRNKTKVMDDDVIDLETDRVIDLEAASPMSKSLHHKRSRKNSMSSPKTRREITRPERSDDDVIEILSPAAAKIPSVAAAKAQKSPHLYDLSESIIDRIREVFPLVSSQKVQSFLERSSSYVDKGESQSDHVVMQIVMTVLSEYPLGENIPDEAFAAAAVGGHIDASAAASEQCCDDNDGKPFATTATGKQKVALLECNCCFVDYPFEEMVSCRTAGHLFCKTCLQKHTEQRVFGLGNLGVQNTTNNNVKSSKNASKALEILCMHSSGCTSGFHEGQLRKALSEKVLKKYDEMQYDAVIQQANTNGDISRCPKCNFIAFAEKTVKTFNCPQCSFKSCRECGEEAHPGIRCDEVESKTETDGRKNVEEAMTQALVRTCPRPFCRKKFLKTDGCNKMTCACGAYVCYVCRKEIPKNVAYAHFCQTPHCNHKNCGKCALYADVTSEDEKRVKEAAKMAAKKQKTDVDVESLLKNPAPVRPPAAARGGRRGRGGGGYVPGHHGGNAMQVQQHARQLNQQIQHMNQQIMRAQQMLQQAQQRARNGGNNGRRRNRGRRR